MPSTTLSLLSACLLSFILAACQSSSKDSHGGDYQVYRSIAFDTSITVQICDQEQIDFPQLFEQLSTRVFALEKAASLYLNDSEISRLNQHGRLNASPSFSHMLDTGIRAGEQTGGHFDISIQPLWDYYQGTSPFSTIDEVLKLVNYQKIKTQDSTSDDNQLVSLQPQMKLSFNGFIQGYLTDELYLLLKEAGVKNALINGGEYRALGKDYSEPWVVTITGENGEPLSEIELHDSEALAVTAGYGYVFSTPLANSQQPSHLFSPKNQQKLNTKATYVVKTTNATQADIYATLAAIVDESRWQQYQPTHAELFVFSN